MSATPDQPDCFVTCKCKHCSGHIEFNSTHAGESVACPHCGLETLLYTNKSAGINPRKDTAKSLERNERPFFLEYRISLLIVATLFVLVLTVCATWLVFQLATQSNSTNQKVPAKPFPVASSTPATNQPVTVAVTVSNTAVVPVVAAARPTPAASGWNWTTSPVVQQGDLQIQVKHWTGNYGYINVVDEQTGETREYNTYFALEITLYNLSATKKIDFTSWRGIPFSTVRDYAILTDNNGNTYKKIDFGDCNVCNTKIETSIYPQHSHVDFVVFEPPVTNLKWLHLELPAANFGGKGMIRFEIPVSQIQDWQ